MSRNHKLSIVVLFSFVLYQALNAQNLIPNGSFEEFKNKDNPYAPKIISNLAGGWEAFTTSPHKIYQPWISVSGKRATYPDPDGYVVLCYFNFQAVKDKQMIKSFFQVPLKEALLKDSLYQLDFFYKITVSSLDKVTRDSLIDERFIQFCILEEKINEIGDVELIPADNYKAMLPKSTYFKNYRSYPIKWCSASCIYKASGGEKFLLFGTFGTSYTKFWCTVEFDKLCLEPCGKVITEIINAKIGNSFIMDNILFDLDKAVLKTSSYNDLNQLIIEMGKILKLKLEISGHTDNTGTDEHNFQLSKQRARAVVDYLVQHGIGKERLSYKGYGSSKPIADNDTEAGRTKNRRVEITIMDK